MLIGSSTTPAPRAVTPSSSSDDWYCGSLSGTEHARSARIARKPNDVSVIRRAVSTAPRTANTRTHPHRATPPPPRPRAGGGCFVGPGRRGAGDEVRGAVDDRPDQGFELAVVV